MAHSEAMDACWRLFLPCKRYQLGNVFRTPSIWIVIFISSSGNNEARSKLALVNQADTVGSHFASNVRMTLEVINLPVMPLTNGGHHINSILPLTSHVLYVPYAVRREGEPPLV